MGNKGNNQWVWLALDVETRLIIGCFVGTRDEAGARGLWQSLPAVYRQGAVWYTDFWRAYNAVLPGKRHKRVNKGRGKPNYVERFTNTRRQRCSRLVRKALSFSKKVVNHIGAIWYFIHDYKARRLKHLTTTSA